MKLPRRKTTVKKRVTEDRIEVHGRTRGSLMPYGLLSTYICAHFGGYEKSLAEAKKYWRRANLPEEVSGFYRVTTTERIEKIDD